MEIDLIAAEDLQSYFRSKKDLYNILSIESKSDLVYCL